MPTKRGSRKGQALDASAPSSTETAAGTPTDGGTGRYLVLLREDAVKEATKVMSSTASMKVSVASDFGEGDIPHDLGGADAVIFENLGIAVVNTPPDQLDALSVTAAEDNPILVIEAEQYVYALPASDDYLRGYRDAINDLTQRTLAKEAAAIEDAFAEALDESKFTWGLQATRVPTSRFSGRGIRVAVLDTGLDLGHPDFAGRSITTRSFITGEPVQDGHGHGTHCIGTACGPRTPRQLPRYGIAFEAQIFAGKVLNNQGSGADGGILSGIDWAVANHCAVVSMSLGAPVAPGQGPSAVYETAAQRALNAGTLIIAAAGNESRRPDGTRMEPPAPVGRPANSPSIMAVAALDANLRVAPFSNGGINPNGGEVNIAGPGVAIRSSWPRPRLYNTISGTSMATPHVAGIAALFAQAAPNARGRALWQLLLQNARHLSLLPRDVGAGLVQALQ
ncbi:MAG: S8 family peptidase [Blastocatellia bacterium]